MGNARPGSSNPVVFTGCVPQWRQPIIITSLGEMAQPTYGTHRVKNPGLEDGVWITDGKNGFEIPESRYRENGYKPRVEELPWRSSTWEGGNAPWPSQ
jgi:hypothetical protein